MSWRAVVVVVGLVLAACAQSARARQMPEARAQLDGDGRWVNGVTESWWLGEAITKAEGAEAAARWKALLDESAGARPAGWEGGYFRGGETHGTYLQWSPRGGFVIARVNKCMALVTGLAYGRVEVTPTHVEFFPEVDKESAGGHGHHGAAHPAAPRAVIRFVPVEWRGERMFIEEEEMDEFGDYVAGLGGYNGRFVYPLLGYEEFFTRGGGKKSATPVVPPGYERFIKRPVEARVISAGRRVLKKDYVLKGANTSAEYEHASVTRVTIDAGTEQGVKEGLLFRVTRPDEGDTVFVTRAGRRTSEAVVVRDLDERGRETFYDNGDSRERRHTRVLRGWRLTTSLFD